MDSAKEQPTGTTPVSVAVTRREPDFAALLDLARSLSPSTDIQAIVSLLGARLPALLGVECAGVVVEDAAGSAPGAVAAVVTTVNTPAQRHSFRLPLSACPQIAAVLASNKPCVLRDPLEGPILSNLLALEGAPGSVALIPIAGPSRPFGVLCFRTTHHSGFADSDLMHAQVIADIAAIVLDHAHTVRALRDEGQELGAKLNRRTEQIKELSKYFSIFEHSREAMLVLAPSGHVLLGNPMAEQLMGRSEGALIGASFTELLAPDEQPLGEELLTGFARSQYPVGIHLHMETGGRRKWVCANFFGVSTDEPTILATLRDVTTERSLGRELAQTRDFLERVIESSVDGIVSADLRGNVLVYNRAAARIFGYAPEEVLGKLRTDDLYPEGVARDIMRLIESDERGGRGRLEEHRVEMLTKSGSHVPVTLSASWVLDGDQPIGTVGIFTDISEKLAMESSLAEAQRELQDRQRQDAIAEVAGAAAHELNQPLTSVMGYAEFLKRAVEADPQLGHAVDVILTETQRMADIVRKVGRITRYETKPYVGAAKIVDLDRASSPEKPLSGRKVDT